MYCLQPTGDGIYILYNLKIHVNKDNLVISPSSAHSGDPNGHNVAVSKLNDKYYVNNDDKVIEETDESYVMKYVSLFAYKCSKCKKTPYI